MVCADIGILPSRSPVIVAGSAPDASCARNAASSSRTACTTAQRGSLPAHQIGHVLLCKHRAYFGSRLRLCCSLISWVFLRRGFTFRQDRKRRRRPVGNDRIDAQHRHRGHFTRIIHRQVLTRRPRAFHARMLGPSSNGFWMHRGEPKQRQLIAAHEKNALPGFKQVTKRQARCHRLKTQKLKWIERRNQRASAGQSRPQRRSTAPTAAARPSSNGSFR